VPSVRSSLFIGIALICFLLVPRLMTSPLEVEGFGPAPFACGAHALDLVLNPSPEPPGNPYAVPGATSISSGELCNELARDKRDQAVGLSLVGLVLLSAAGARAVRAHRRRDAASLARSA